jgi:hypothetical protein
MILIDHRKTSPAIRLRLPRSHFTMEQSKSSSGQFRIRVCDGTIVNCTSSGTRSRQPFR